MAVVNCGLNNIYSDELISATELNRQPGHVLDRGLEHPVTITRNDNAFALLRREEMAALVKAARQTRVVVEVINVAYRLSQGKDIGSDHPYEWLKAFDTEELNELNAETINAFRLGCDTCEWDMLDAALPHSNEFCS